MKKTFYIFLVMTLGFLLSVIAHAFVERWQIGYLLSEGVMPAEQGFFGKVCYLSPILSYSIMSIGIVGGYFLGQTWWRIVYIEKRHWRNRKKKKRK